MYLIYFLLLLKYWINEYLDNIGVGIYHSGIELYGNEYSYGGHSLSSTGVFKTQPRDSEELGDNFKFKWLPIFYFLYSLK